MKPQKKCLPVVVVAMFFSISHHSYGQQIPLACERLTKPYEVCTKDYLMAEAHSMPDSGKTGRTELDPKYLEVDIKAAIKKEGMPIVAERCASEQKRSEIFHALTNMGTAIAFMGGNSQRCFQSIASNK